MDLGTLETWLWDAACTIRGPVEASKYKDYILPLIFLKRLSDVFEDELLGIAEGLDHNTELAEQFAEKDRKLTRFYIPSIARWSNIAKQTTNLGEYLTNCVRDVAKENPELDGVINAVDFNATVSGQRIIGDDSLKRLIQVLGRHRLGLKDVEPDILGRAYEYLIRKFAEDSGQSAGEFYTPREVALMMAYMADPQPGQEIYDPCCGSAGLLIKCQLRSKEKYQDKKVAPLKFYGQEINPTTYAMARMNIFIHDMSADIRLGDTMKNPAFLNSDGSLKKFDLILANPMWNQKFEQRVYETDPYGRFTFGFPPESSADWGWIQHMYASLKEKGKMLVVLDTGAVSRGSGTSGKNKERDIRKSFVDQDLIEAVVLLPENLFYNTTAPGIILVINKNKPEERKGKVLLMNISDLYQKGRPKNYLPESTILKVYELYSDFKEEEGISKVVELEEIVRNDYNLSPSRYVSKNGVEEVLPLEEAVVELEEAEEERKEVERELWEILRALRLYGV